MQNTFHAVRRILVDSLFDANPELQYITVDRITAMVLLDLVEDAIDREEQKDGA